MEKEHMNTRPTAEPEDELAEAKRYNDTDKPLSEVMAAISDAVLLVMPDAESCSGGTIIERVEAAVECATALQAKLQEARRVVEKMRGEITNCYCTGTELCGQCVARQQAEQWLKENQ